LTTIFGFISERFANSVLVTVLSEDGIIITKFEAYTAKKAKEFFQADWAQRAYAREYPDGFQLAWLDTPINSPDYHTAIERYENNWFIPFYGRPRESRP